MSTNSLCLDRFFLLLFVRLNLALCVLGWHPHHQLGHTIRFLLIAIVRLADTQFGLQRLAQDRAPLAR